MRNTNTDIGTSNGGRSVAWNWSSEKGGKYGLSWDVSARKGRYTIGMNLATGSNSNTYRLNLLDQEGQLMDSRMVRTGKPWIDNGEVFEPYVYYRWEVEFPRDGQYQVEFLQDRHREHLDEYLAVSASALVAKSIYLKPFSSERARHR